MHPHQLTDPAAIREFVLAGNARLTLVSRKTGTRFTYRVRAADGKGPASHFVGVLNGSDNEGDYAYLGVVNRKTGAYYHGRKSKISSSAPSALAFEWFAAKVLTDDGVMPEQLECWTEGRCGRCNRTLTDPASIARGIGPECASMMGAAA